MDLKKEKDNNLSQEEEKYLKFLTNQMITNHKINKTQKILTSKTQKNNKVRIVKEINQYQHKSQSISKSFSMRKSLQKAIR